MRGGAEAYFYGSHTNRIDAKGRLATPAVFRRILNLDRVNAIYCIPSADEPCLDCGGFEFVENLQAMIRRLDPYSPERRSLELAVTAQTYVVSPDKEGRIILPQKLRDHARLDGEAAFAGRGEFFQIWNPVDYEKVVAAAIKEAGAAKLGLRALSSNSGDAS
ncbi:MAG: division/cell wall cluster transcriptional repressor MraZ [Parvularculaceae bacterium]